MLKVGLNRRTQSQIVFTAIEPLSSIAFTTRRKYTSKGIIPLKPTRIDYCHNIRIYFNRQFNLNFSYSTGCLEGEAMGVTKTLMASNDTLFNFEDTLGDRDDMFSPRTPSAASQLDHVQSSRSSSSSIYECRTPTSTPAVASTVFTSEDMITKCNTGDERPRSNSIPNEDTVNDSFTFATGAVDLLSPDQQKTFSEDICSADLSAAADATFTTTTTTLEEKTCISVPLAAKDGLQRLSQVSEPEWGSSMLLDMSLEDIPSLNAFDDLTDDSQEQRQNSCDDLNATVILSDANTISSALSVVDKNQQNNDFDFLTAVTHFGYQTKELYQRSDADTAEKENTNPNEGTATKLENAATVEKLFFEEPDLIRNCSDQTFVSLDMTHIKFFILQSNMSIIAG